MANVKFSKAEIEKHFKLNANNLDRITMFGTPVESLTDTELEISVTPNRPDLLSIHGFVRAFKRFLGKSKPQEYKIKPSGEKIIVDKSLADIRPYSMAVIIRKVKFTDERIKEIMQWQEKVHATIGRNRKKVALGYYDLNKIKFPVRYIAKEPKDIVFEPLDMPEKMNAIQILSRHPTGREYGKQLDGLSKFPVYYDSNNEVLSMPPIINSNNSGKITPGVSDILIECSGTDLDTLKKVITMAAADLIDCGGKAFSVDVVYGSKTESIDFKPERMRISLESINKTLGLNLKEKELENLLSRMGYNYSAGKVSIPAWRTDILHEVDIAEDAAIAYGYENLIPEIPEVSTVGQESKESKLKSKISEMLTGLGLIEISSFHLIKEDETNKLGVEEKIEAEGSKTEYKYLRQDLLTPALRIFAENKDNEYPQKIFEIGAVFSMNKRAKTETGIIEEQNLLIASSPGNFTEIKRILDYLARMLGLEYQIEESSKKGMIDGRTGSITLNGKKIGYIGEVHPDTLHNWNIKMPIALIEISLEEIVKNHAR